MPGCRVLKVPQLRPRMPRSSNVPWLERAVDSGVGGDGIGVMSDAGRSQTQRLAGRVAQTRGAFAPLFDGIPLQAPESPRLLVFKDPTEMSFVVRRSFGTKIDGETVLFFKEPFRNQHYIAVTIAQPSEYGGERALQRAAFQQYAFPRFHGVLPPWALVGLTEYAGVLQFNTRQPESGHAPPEFIDALQRADVSHRLLPLGRLLELDPESWLRFESTHGTELLNAQAWAMVQFMMHGRSGELVEPFRRWLHRVAVRKEPTANLLELLRLDGDRDALLRLEEAFRDYHRSLEASSLLALRECAELVRTALEQLELEGVRVNSPLALVDEITLHEPVRQVLFEVPYERTISSNDAGLFDGVPIEFKPTRLGRREVEDLETPPPMDVLMGDSSGHRARITWRHDADEERWIPKIEWEE